MNAALPRTLSTGRRLARQAHTGWRWAVLLLGLACTGGICLGGEPVRTRDAPLVYRRVFVPEEAIRGQEAFPVEGETYLPVRRDEFEQLLGSVQSQRLAPVASLGARVAEGTYTASLEGEDLLHGIARLTVVHRAATPGDVLLAPCDLVIDKPVWTPQSAASPDGSAAVAAQAAKIGCDDSGRLVAPVNGSGVLQFDWTLRGAKGAAGEVTFDLQLPASSVSQLKLALPKGLQPLVSTGVVTPPAGTAGDQTTEPWLIQVRGDAPARLVIVPAEARQVAGPLGLLRQQAVHSISPDADELAVVLKLDVYRQPLSQLALAIDGPLQLIQATYGKTPLAWREVAAPQRQITLQFREPILGTGHEIALQAVAPVTLGQRWKLPRMVATELLWQEGTTTVEVAESLILDRIQITDGVQTQAGPLAAPRRGEAIVIKDYHAATSAELVLQSREADVLAQTGTSVRLGLATANLTYVAELRATAGPLYLLELDTSPAWIVDLVETQPAELLETWNLQRRGNQPRLMQVRLNGTPASDGPLRLLVHAHRSGLQGSERLSGKDLRWGTLRRARTTRRLVALTADAPHQVRLYGDAELTRLAPEALTEGERGLLQATSGAVLFLDSGATDGLQVAFRSELPQYTADIKLDATCTAKNVRQSLAIRCVPQHSKVDRVLVQFSGIVGPALHWSARGEQDLTVQSRQLDTAGQPAHQSSGGETWEIVLPQAQDKPFELLATWTGEFAGTFSVPFVSVPRAATQVGYLTLRTSEAMPLKIDAQNLKAVPPQSPPDGMFTTTLRNFRYEPAQENHCRVAQTAEVGPSVPAWVWRCRLDSRFSHDGRGDQLATYWIESRGRPNVTLTSPRGVELLEIRVDGKPLPLPAEDSARAKVVVPLPPEARFPTLGVRYVTRHGRLQAFSSASVPWPSLDLPTLERQWLVRLPATYEIAGEERTGSDSAWQRRVFGPLVRPLSQPRFQPFSPDSWLSLPGLVDAAEADPRRRTGVALLRGLAEECQHVRSAGLDAADISWSALLTGATQRLRKSERAAPARFLIDQAALAERGLGAATPLVLQPALGLAHAGKATDADELAEGGAELLEHSGLVVVVHQDWLLLTVRDAMVAYARELQAGPYPCLTLAPNGSQLERLVSPANTLRITTLAAWTHQPALPQRCWTWNDEDDPLGASNEGRNVWCVPVAADRAGSADSKANAGRSPREAEDRAALLATNVLICRQDVLTALGWATLLMSFGLAVWLTRRHIVWAVPLVGLAGVIALLGPEIFTPLLSGGFLGTLAGAMVSLARPLGFPAPWKSSSGSSKFSLVTVPSSAAMLILVLALIAAAVTRAAEPASAGPAKDAVKAVTAAEAKKVYQVLYPIDKAGQPTDYVLVPPDFHALLRHEASGHGESTRQWIIDDAAYRVTFELDTMTNLLVAKELVSEYRLQTYRPQTRIILPIAQEQAYLVPNRARLDGNPAAVSWETGGASLAVDVPELGEATLQLAFRPRVETSNSTARFELRIPPVPNARVHLQRPVGAPPVECPSALGGAVLDTPSDDRVVQLGPADRLQVQWFTDPDLNAHPTDLVVDQLAWLRIQPGAAVLETRFKVSCLAGRIRELEVLADPRLQFLPPQGDQPIQAYQEKDGTPRTIRLVLKPPYQQEVAFQAQFVMTGISTLEALRVPRLEAVAQRTNRRWLAVSVDRSLQCETPPDTVPVADPAAFIAAWGESEEVPLFVLAVPDGEPAAAAAIRPQKATVTANQRTDVICGLERAEIQFQADLEVVDGSVFQYELTVPAAVSVAAVSVCEGDQERVTRWSRQAGDRMVARLQPAVSGKHQLLLQATLPWPAGAKSAIPRIAFVDATVTAEQGVVYRRPQVQVRVPEQPGLVALPAASIGEYRKDWGRCVAAWTATAAKPAAAIPIEVAPNRPKTRGVLLMALRRDKDLWRAEADYEVHIESGILDTLRLEIPAEWTGPFAVDLDAEQEIVALPGQDRRHLVIRPRQPLSESCRLHILGTVSVPPGERVRVPDVAPLDMDQAASYVVAPRKLGAQTIAWETSGLQETNLPDGRGAWDPALHVGYVVTQPRFHAVIKDVEPDAGSPLVTLADICLDCRADGSVLGVATWDLQSGGLATCELELPKEYGLVHASLGALPALLQPRGAGRWQVPLGPPQLAQQLQLVFRGNLPPPQPSAGSRWVLHAPKLLSFPVAKTLWTVQTPADRIAKLSPAESQLDPCSLEIARFQQRADLIESTSAVLAEIDPNMTARWYDIWLRRLALARNKVAHWRVKQPAAAESRSSAQAAVEERYLSIVGRLSHTEPASQPDPITPQVTEPADVWQIALSRPGTTAQRLSRTEPGAVELHWQPVPDPEWHGRLAAVAVLLGLSLAAFFAVPFPGFARWRWRCVPLTGVTLGFVWWLWLTPSVFGVFLTLLSLLAWSSSLLVRFLATEVRQSK